MTLAVIRESVVAAIEGGAGYDEVFGVTRRHGIEQDVVDVVAQLSAVDLDYRRSFDRKRDGDDVRRRERSVAVRGKRERRVFGFGA